MLTRHIFHTLIRCFLCRQMLLQLGWSHVRFLHRLCVKFLCLLLLRAFSCCHFCFICLRYFCRYVFCFRSHGGLYSLLCIFLWIFIINVYSSLFSVIFMYFFLFPSFLLHYPKIARSNHLVIPFCSKKSALFCHKDHAIHLIQRLVTVSHVLCRCFQQTSYHSFFGHAVSKQDSIQQSSVSYKTIHFAFCSRDQSGALQMQFDSANISSYFHFHKSTVASLLFFLVFIYISYKTSVLSQAASSRFFHITYIYAKNPERSLFQDFVFAPHIKCLTNPFP